MNRRSFFSRVAGGFVAAVATAVLARQAKPEQFTTLTFKGEPFAFDYDQIDTTRIVFYNSNVATWRANAVIVQ